MCILGLTAAVAIARAAPGQDESESSLIVESPIPTDPHMPEALRSQIKKLVVIAGQAPPSGEVTGSYDKEMLGLLGGMSEGSRIGTISKEIGGVPVNIPIPVIGTLGAIYGGISGAAKEKIQAFRDELTEELISADSPPLRSDGLAIDAFWAIRKLPTIESHLFAPTVEIPNDTDAILFVSLNDLTIDVQGKEAIITASAGATLRRLSDGLNVYETEVQYQDRDTLSNWTENDNELWRNYTNFARYYLGRELAADVFDRVMLNHELRPAGTDTAKQVKKNNLQFVSQSLTPTLAWDLSLAGGDGYGAWTGSIDESEIFYDVEIFDNRQLVYDEKQVPDPRHTLAFELEACHMYRWTVRPVYHVGSEIKYGEWMRFGEESVSNDDAKKGLSGRQASEAPAYIQDFASLEIECRRR